MASQCIILALICHCVSMTISTQMLYIYSYIYSLQTTDTLATQKFSECYLAITNKIFVNLTFLQTILNFSYRSLYFDKGFKMQNSVFWAKNYHSQISSYDILF